MTTVAKARRKQSGQSMLEFAFLVPVIVGMLMILIQVEGAISTSIVNQKYARATLQFLLFNNRYFVEEQFVKDVRNPKIYQRFWAGVSDDLVGVDEDGSPTTLTEPVAPTRKIGRSAAGADDSPQSEFSMGGDGVTARQNVRIRSTAFICIPPEGNQGFSYFSEGNLREDTFLAGSYQYCKD